MLPRILLLAASVLLTGCGSSTEPMTPPAPAAAPSTQEPLTAAEASFVTQAHKIAPKIVGTDERLAARASNTCSSLAESHAKAIDQAVQRFSSDSYAVTRAQAEKLVEAARTTVCASG